VPQTMGEQSAISFGWLSESPFNVSNAYLCLIIKGLVFLKGFRLFFLNNVCSMASDF